MNSLIFANQHLLRITLFIVIFAVIALIENYWPKKTVSRKTRWRRNFSLLATDIIAVRILLPVTIVEVAFIANTYSIGLFNVISIPFWVNVLCTVLIFDLLIYTQHVLFHKVSPLWKIHRVHHTDTGFDATTGVRFHPLELLLSSLLKIIGVLILGPAVVAVIVYEILLNSFSLVTHGNTGLPFGLDRAVRKVLVTPDMHRIHHSIHKRETDSNYGNVLSCWDRIFGTYIDQPQDGQWAMRLGLEDYRDEQSQKIQSLLLLPLKP